jgi:hypothetical protein
MNNDAPAMVGDWIVKRRRSRYTLLYWLSLVLGIFGEATPNPPEVTYTLRHRVSGAERRVTLPGDHTPADLSAVVNVLRETAPPPVS